MIPTELIQILGNLPFFALACIVAIVAIRNFAPLFGRIADSNNRLAESYSRLSETLSTVSKESTANTKVVAELANTTSITGLGTTDALNKIAQGLETTMQRDAQMIDLQKQSSDVGVQTLTKTTTIESGVTKMDEMVGQILETVLHLRDKMKNLDHPTTMTLEDWKPLDEMLAGVERRIVEAIAHSSASHTLPPDTLMFTDQRNPNGSTSIESETMSGTVPPEATDKKD